MYGTTISDNNKEEDKEITAMTVKKDKRTLEELKEAGEVPNLLAPIRLEFSHKIGRRRFFHFQCSCNKIFLGRSDGRKKSCGCNRGDSSHKGTKNQNITITHDSLILRSARGVYKGCYDDGDINFEEFLELSKKECFYCDKLNSNKVHAGFTHSGKIKMETKLDKNGVKYDYCPTTSLFPEAWFYYNGLDRLDSSKPHTKDNVVTCCIVCNKLKNKSTKEEFFLHIKKILSNV